jgi:hypothetical protein
MTSKESMVGEGRATPLGRVYTHAVRDNLW